MHWSKLETYFTAMTRSASCRQSGDAVSAKAYEDTAEKALAALMREAVWHERTRLAELREKVRELGAEKLVLFREGYKAGTGGDSAENLGEAYLAGYIHGHLWWRNVR